MTSPAKICLLVLSFGLASDLAMAVGPSAGLRPGDRPASNPEGRVYSEGKEDPPGVLNQQSLASIRELATTLSSDRSWLTREVVEGLDSMSLYLDEVFSSAPKFVEVDGKLYRLVLEQVGDDWQNFNPKSSRYLVFLNQEVYDGLGENYALGFEKGKEKVLVEDDLAGVASIGLTLRGVTPDEKPQGSQGVVNIQSPIKLGKARPRPQIRGPVENNPLGLANGAQATTSCAYMSAPIYCSSGIPVCGSSSATPYFILTNLMIKTDHEGAFKGDPETELFPLRVNVASPPGGSSNIRTDWMFSGRNVIDLAGRSVFLPDVENDYQWYSISNGGLALFPSNVSHPWVATLVENDDDDGLLELSKDRNNPIRIGGSYSTTTGFKFDLFDFLKSVGLQFLQGLGILNDSDDLWVESLEVSNSAFCSQGVGQPHPYNFFFDSSEWAMQGHFACIDPACIQTPPPPVYEPGPGCLNFENTQPCF